MRKAGFFKGGRFMAKGLIHGENGDMLQMESVFLIKLLSRFSWFELFHLVRWKRAFPSVFRAAVAALVCDAGSTVLAEKIVIIRRRDTVSVPKIACQLLEDPSALQQEKAQGSFSGAGFAGTGEVSIRTRAQAQGCGTSSGLGRRLPQELS